jgi:hypothetical protein
MHNNDIPSGMHTPDCMPDRFHYRLPATMAGFAEYFARRFSSKHFEFHDREIELNCGLKGEKCRRGQRHQGAAYLYR